MRADNTDDGLSFLAACTTDVKQWYMQNGLQLNPDKSEVLLMGMTNQLRAASCLTSLPVAGVDLPVGDSMKVLGVTLDRCLTFDNYVSAVAQSCNYHARAIRHIHHLLTQDLAQALACSLILSRIDYCNAVLCGSPSGMVHHSEAAAGTKQHCEIRKQSGARQMSFGNVHSALQRHLFGTLCQHLF